MRKNSKGLGGTFLRGGNATQAGKLKFMALGISGDQTQHLLARIKGCELTDAAGLQPKTLVVAIGTNNLGDVELKTPSLASKRLWPLSVASGPLPRSCYWGYSHGRGTGRREVSPRPRMTSLRASSKSMPLCANSLPRMHNTCVTSTHGTCFLRPRNQQNNSQTRGVRRRDNKAGRGT